jgi:hypothetical protein
VIGCVSSGRYLTGYGKTALRSTAFMGGENDARIRYLGHQPHRLRAG